MSLHKLPLITPKKHGHRNYVKLSNKNINKNDFLEWLVGFTDAEGSFLIGVDHRNNYPRFNFRFSIGLHIDDRPLLLFIQNNLNCGTVTSNKDQSACYFNIADTVVLKSVILPIFDNFNLNTTKHLDYLAFKEALLLEIPQSNETDLRLEYSNKIINLKNNMNLKRTDYSLPLNHIKITPYWLLGLIEGEGSFHLRRNSLTPTFSLALTATQKPVLEAIICFLKGQLDKYSLVKVNETKLLNLSYEKAIANSKPKFKLTILQIDYLMNIFIPFLENLHFNSKKRLDFEDFKCITTLIYQGKHNIPEVKDFILQLSYSMNNFRLSTSKINNISKGKEDLVISINQKEIYLNLPPLYISNNEKQIISIQTGKIVRDIYVIEVENTQNIKTIYPSISHCAQAIGVSRPTLLNRIETGDPLLQKDLIKIRKVRVFN